MGNLQESLGIKYTNMLYSNAGDTIYY